MVVWRNALQVGDGSIKLTSTAVAAGGRTSLLEIITFTVSLPLIIGSLHNI